MFEKKLEISESIIKTSYGKTMLQVGPQRHTLTQISACTTPNFRRKNKVSKFNHKNHKSPQSLHHILSIQISKGTYQLRSLQILRHLTCKCHKRLQVQNKHNRSPASAEHKISAPVRTSASIQTCGLERQTISYKKRKRTTQTSRSKIVKSANLGFFHHN